MVRYMKIPLLLALLLFAGCKRSETAPAATGLFFRTITVDGLSRRYAIYIPANGGHTSIPLILVLHGGGGKIENMTGQTGKKSPYKLWMEIADREKCIVIYPQAVDGPAGRPNWNDCRANASVLPQTDDVKFISSLVDETIRDHPIDTTRIFATGVSNGGIMTLRLATELPGRFAAVAPIAASMPDTSECLSPATPLSILFMNGTADPLMPYDGGIINNPPNPAHGSVMPVDTAVKQWVMLDHVDTVPEIITLPDLDPFDESTVTRYIYSGGTDATAVVLYKIIGGGHTAPSIREQYSQLWLNYVGTQNHDIEMVEVIWDFFRDKKRVVR